VSTSGDRCLHLSVTTSPCSCIFFSSGAATSTERSAASCSILSAVVGPYTLRKLQPDDPGDIAQQALFDQRVNRMCGPAAAVGMATYRLGTVEKITHPRLLREWVAMKVRLDDQTVLQVYHGTPSENIESILTNNLSMSTRKCDGIYSSKFPAVSFSCKNHAKI
jgi:hypothetical protein